MDVELTSKRRHRRKAVFPRRPRRTGQKIGRSWLDPDCLSIPAFLYFSAKSEVTRCEKRDAGDIGEMRIVPVPSDPGTGSVFVYENLGEGIGRLCRKCSDLRPERKKKVRDRDSLDYPSMVEIVAQPKPDNASICQMAVKIERLEEGVQQQLTALLLVFARRKLHRAS